MIIGIIGAGIAGLTAGRELAKNGHEVIVIEKSKGFGGRLATRYAGEGLKVKLDHGSSSFTAKNETFRSFVSELESKGVVRPWTDSFSFYNEDGFFEAHPGRENETQFMAPEGMNAIGKYMSRWMDFRLETRVSGITMVAPGGISKRPWVINFFDSSVLEVDALIIATPAIQANGILQTSQDETPIRSLAAKITKVQYNAIYSVMLGYGKRETPSWKGIVCQDENISWISNESSKRDNGELTLVAHTTPEFARAHRNDALESIPRLILPSLEKAAGRWASNPHWNYAHFWLYHRAQNTLNVPYLESSSEYAPLALIGDYFEGNTVESAYLSGYKLAQNWLNKLKNP